MKRSDLMTKIRRDLNFCSKNWTVLYGSLVKGGYILNRSDVDVAIITRTNDKESNLKFWVSLLEKITPCYDIKIFELLPLFLKIEIIESYYVLFGESLEISEYFYFYRKMWKDVVRRYKFNQFKNIEEKIILRENQKRIVSE